MFSSYDSSFLAGRTFSFGWINRTPWSMNFTLGNDGHVTGFNSPNERFWEVQDSRLIIRNSDREVRLVFDTMSFEGGVLSLTARLDNDATKIICLQHKPAEKHGFASLVSPSGIWETRLQCAVFVRTTRADEKFLDLISKLRASSRHFDVYGLIDQSRGPVLPPKEIPFVPFSEQECRKLGFSQKTPGLFYDLGDLSFYFALRARPGYNFYIFLDDDVDFLENDAAVLAELVQHPDFGATDFVGLEVHDQDPTKGWGPASVKRYGERFCKYCYYPLVCLSKRALSFMYSQRQVEAASNLETSDLCQCESFTPSSLQAGGFVCADLKRFVPGCYNWASVAKQLFPDSVGSPMTYQQRSPGIRLVHPVYTPEEYLRRVEKKFIVIRHRDHAGLAREMGSEEFLSLPAGMAAEFVLRMQSQYGVAPASTPRSDAATET